MEFPRPCVRFCLRFFVAAKRSFMRVPLVIPGFFALHRLLAAVVVCWPAPGCWSDRTAVPLFCGCASTRPTKLPPLLIRCPRRYPTSFVLSCLSLSLPFASHALP